MATWTVNTGRKDLTEVQIWTKDGSEIKYSTGWRSGTWIVTTSDDNEPQIEADENGIVDMNFLEGSNIEECEFDSTYDGCWDDWEFSDDISDEEQERIQEGWAEEAYSFLEEDGWMDVDTFFYAHKDELTFEREEN